MHPWFKYTVIVHKALDDNAAGEVDVQFRRRDGAGKQGCYVHIYTHVVGQLHMSLQKPHLCREAVAVATKVHRITVGQTRVRDRGLLSNYRHCTWVRLCISGRSLIAFIDTFHIVTLKHKRHGGRS